MTSVNPLKDVDPNKPIPTQRSNAGHAQMGAFFGSRAPISRAKI